MLGGGCCDCEQACGIFADDFSTDRLASRYEQLSGSWSVTGGYLTTANSGAVLKLKARTDDETAQVALLVEYLAMTAGDTIRLCIGATSDGSAYLYAEIVDGGDDCATVTLGSTAGGTLSRTYHVSKTNGGSTFKPVFLALDEQGWLHFGEFSPSSTPAMRTIAAVQATAPGSYAMLAVPSAGASGVRFNSIALNNYAFEIDDTGTSPIGECFTHVVPCGSGAVDAGETAITWYDSGVSIPCSALVVSGDFIAQYTPGFPDQFIGAYRSDGDGLLVNGLPNVFNGNQMTARVSVWSDTGASAKVRLFVDADADGAGGPYVEVNIPASGPATFQLFSAGGSDLTEAVNLWDDLGSGVISSPLGFGGDYGGIITLTREGNQLRAQIGDNIIAAYYASWSDGGYAAVETVDVSGNIAVNYPGCYADLDEAHPIIRSGSLVGDDGCYQVAPPNCNTCTADGTTIRTITVTVPGFTFPASPLTDQDDDGCCAGVAGTYVLSVNDLANYGYSGDADYEVFCRWEKEFSWCYGRLFTDSFGWRGEIAPDSAKVRVRVALTNTRVVASVAVLVGIKDSTNGPPYTTVTTVAHYEVTPGDNPRENCETTFTLPLDHVVVLPNSTWELCDISGSVDVEFSA